MPWRGQHRSGDSNPADGQPDRLVNRYLEVELLRDHISGVTGRGQGRALLLLGESGVGKSRLATEAAAIAHERRMRVMQAQCVGRGAEPLLPFKEALAGELGRSPERIRRMLSGASPALLESLPFVGRFLGALGKAFTDAGQFEAAALHGVYEELARVLVGLAERTGLCLVVEDLHAADQDTLYFLHYFLKKVRHRRIVLVATIQEEQLPENPTLADLVAQWTAAGDAVLTVLPLERAHVGEYARGVVLAGHPVDDALVDRLFRLTGGNPFFLKETVRLLTGPARPGAISPLDEQMDLPARAEIILRNRLARASDATRTQVDAAAVVLETTQDLGAIAAVVELDDDVALRALSQARELRLLREGPHGDVSFTHDLMHRTAYRALGVNARRHLHRRAARWSEQAGHLASASYHFERAGDTEDMVRTAMDAAARAERAGMYHSALLQYQRARPHLDLAELGPLLGRALVVLGEWDQAQELIDALPANDGRARLLRSELRFVQGDFEAAAVEAQAALDTGQVDQVDVLIRLADVALYVGDLAEAQRRGQQALVVAEQSGDLTQQARCLGIIGAGAFFGGEIGAGEASFSRALDLVVAQPADERDRTIQAVFLGNLANVAETRGDWQRAESLHDQALRLRREVADARGALHSLHGLGRSKRRLGDDHAGMALIDEAEQLAIDLDEPLERAKITHSRADLALESGDCATAQELAMRALTVFVECHTTYDTAHARLSLGDASRRCGDERSGVSEASRARSAIERHGFGLLRHLRPDIAYPWARRIAGALVAYACGDALGLPWENEPTRPANEDEVEQVPSRRGWLRGATSDDTSLTLLVAEHLAQADASRTAESLLARIAAVPEIRGAGPSTSRAIEGYRATGALPHDGGHSNGAPMRAMPIGWLVSVDEPERRRGLAVELSRATHPDAEAQAAACVVAACAAWALEGASPELLMEVAVEEQRAAAALLGLDDGPTDLLVAVAAGTWEPPAEGISLDPFQAVAAALDCVRRATSLRDGLLRAVMLGGDTDTVASMVGGLLGARLDTAAVRRELAWHTAVQLPDEMVIGRLADGLAAQRAVPV